MLQPLAVDVGHGYVKALSARARVVFPALIGPAPTQVDLADFAPTEVLRIDGMPYLCGEPARAHAAPRWSRYKAQDLDTLRLMLVAAARLDLHGPIQLATGLPLSWYGHQRKAFREALLAYGGTVQLPDRPAHRLWFESVTVLPQGLAAALTLLLDPDRQPGTYLVLDHGYRTTEYLIVTKSANGTVDADPTQAGSLELGTHAIAATVATGLETDYRLPFSAVEVEEADQVYVRGQAVALAERRAAAAHAVSTQIRDRLTEVLDARIAKVVGVLQCGGGAPVLHRAFPEALIPEDPQWANVSAYWGSVADATAAIS